MFLEDSEVAPAVFVLRWVKVDGPELEFWPQGIVGEAARSPPRAFSLQMVLAQATRDDPRGHCLALGHEGGESMLTSCPERPSSQSRRGGRWGRGGGRRRKWGPSVGKWQSCGADGADGPRTPLPSAAGSCVRAQESGVLSPCVSPQ